MIRKTAPLFAALVALVACGSPSPTPKLGKISLPQMNQFSSRATPRVSRNNATVAGDFLTLAFQLENGNRLPVLSRFEGPISVTVVGKAPPTLGPDLHRLLGRLRNEARIDISQVPASQQANITIEVITRAQMRRVAPSAACFVAPGISGWGELRRNRTRWEDLQTRTRMAIFLPGDVAPQEIRDCLNEELAQTLGPVNDLYRLHDSVFNDDDIHTVLTGFDMLILRAFYAPELHSGMRIDQVAPLLPGILQRLNPNGGVARTSAGLNLGSGTASAWNTALTGALGSRSTAVGLPDAKRAVAIARSQGWNDHRLAYSLFVYGRLVLGSNGSAALGAFLQAEQIYQSSPQTRLHAAFVGEKLAAYALTTGEPEGAINLVNRHIPAIIQAQNARLLATMLMIKAEALDDLNRPEEAKIIRLDSLGWARYGFGTDTEIRQRLATIAALSPK